MKRIDYFWPRAIFQITWVVLLTQTIVELLGARKSGYEWVMPVCGIAFSISAIWVCFVIVWNAIRARGEA